MLAQGLQGNCNSCCDSNFEFKRTNHRFVALASGWLSGFGIRKGAVCCAEFKVHRSFFESGRSQGRVLLFRIPMVRSFQPWLQIKSVTNRTGLCQLIPRNRANMQMVHIGRNS